MHPQTDPGDWSDDRIRDELQARVAGAGATIRTGRISSRSVLQFRSFVREPMQYGRLFLAGSQVRILSAREWNRSSEAGGP